MPADEVAHGAEADESRARTGPRHAVPRKPLFTRFHVPAGRAIAMAAMPTAVLMGMGFTSTLAVADNNSSMPSAKSLTIDEYKDCVAALDELKGKDKASASPTPSASASAGDSAEDGTSGKDGTAEPAPSATSSAVPADGADKSSSGPPSSSDSGSDDKAAPEPSASAPGSEPGGSGAGDTATPAPSESASRSGGLLEPVGDAIGSVLTGGKSDPEESPAAGATPSASATPSADGTKDATAPAGRSGSDTAEHTPGKATGAVEDTVEDTTGTASGTSGAAEDAGEAAEDAAGEVTASPSPSASATTDLENCPVATDAVGGVDNTVPLADDPWYLDASSLLLRGADYKGVVEVRTANGTVKKALKYVVSDGTDIGDLHQTVKDGRSGKTYHVQAAKGSMSRIRGGETVMYTESISGNLFGLPLKVTFSPDNPPPLNLPLIYFTDVKVVQAAQFGGNLTIPGMHLHITD